MTLRYSIKPHAPKNIKIYSKIHQLQINFIHISNIQVLQILKYKTQVQEMLIQQFFTQEKQNRRFTICGIL